MSEKKGFVKEITDPNIDFPQWYTDVILKTKLVDYGPVKGTMVIRPYGYAIWENIQRELDRRFKSIGVENAYFPLFIPYNYLLKEAEHVEGFAPEVALVTHVGNEPLPEKLVVRPTSETIICEMYSKWIDSYRDLPMLINQWANVVRWEKTTRPFLRTSEFLWQEGHTVHTTPEEANEFAKKMLEIYEEFARTILAIPVLTGKKSEKEKFAGAKSTYSMEAMMLDGKSLQAGTTHDLSDNFSKAFDIKFLNKDGKHKHPYQSSWGVSTRLIGALIMAHGDERGLCLPPKVAPTQVIIVPIAMHKDGVIDTVKDIEKTLQSTNIRIKIDLNKEDSPGWKFNQYEMQGIPIRVEIGPRDIENGTATIVRRDMLGQKFTAKINELHKYLPKLLNEIGNNMLIKATKFRDEHIKTVTNMQELGEAINNNNFALAMWCGSEICETEIKTKFAASSRVMPFDQTHIAKKCVCCGKIAKIKIYFAKAY